MTEAADGPDGLAHGGALDRAARRYGIAKSAWLDLSTGINPWPYPLPNLSEEVWHRLPDVEADAALTAAAADYLGLACSDALVPTPGSQAAIQLLPRLFAPGRVAILGFTYAEHARCWRLAGHEVVAAPAEADADWLGRAEARYAVVTNPNNPTGANRTPTDLLTLAAALAHRGGRLVVDEAFCDILPALSVAAAAGRPDGPVVLRSFGKVFGLAGLRLGLVAADPALGQAIRSHQGPWAVSGPALAIGSAAYRDHAWIAATRPRLAAAAATLSDRLRAVGLPDSGGTPLFRLVVVPPEGGVDAATRTLRLYDRCARGGVLLRRFPERPTWLRFGLPPDAAALERLTRLLTPA